MVIFSQWISEIFPFRQVAAGDRPVQAFAEFLEPPTESAEIVVLRGVHGGTPLRLPERMGRTTQK